jgi:hypothetical protein
MALALIARSHSWMDVGLTKIYEEYLGHERCKSPNQLLWSVSKHDVVQCMLYRAEVLPCCPLSMRPGATALMDLYLSIITLSAAHHSL